MVAFEGLVGLVCCLALLHGAHQIQAAPSPSTAWASRLVLEDPGRAYPGQNMLTGVPKSLVDKRDNIHRMIEYKQAKSAVDLADSSIKTLKTSYAMQFPLNIFLQTIYMAKIKAQAVDGQYYAALLTGAEYLSYCASLPQKCPQSAMVKKLITQIEDAMKAFTKPAELLGLDKDELNNEEKFKAAYRRILQPLEPRRNMWMQKGYLNYVTALHKWAKEKLEALYDELRGATERYNQMKSQYKPRDDNQSHHNQNLQRELQQQKEEQQRLRQQLQRQQQQQEELLRQQQEQLKQQQQELERLRQQQRQQQQQQEREHFRRQQQPQQQQRQQQQPNSQPQPRPQARSQPEARPRPATGPSRPQRPQPNGHSSHSTPKSASPTTRPRPSRRPKPKPTPKPVAPEVKLDQSMIAERAQVESSKDPEEIIRLSKTLINRIEANENLDVKLVSFLHELYLFKINTEIQNSKFLHALRDTAQFASMCARQGKKCTQLASVLKIREGLEQKFKDDQVAMLGLDKADMSHRGKLKKAQLKAAILLHPDKNMQIDEENRKYVSDLFHRANVAFGNLMSKASS